MLSPSGVADAIFLSLGVLCFDSALVLFGLSGGLQTNWSDRGPITLQYLTICGPSKERRHTGIRSTGMGAVMSIQSFRCPFSIYQLALPTEYGP